MRVRRSFMIEGKKNEIEAADFTGSGICPTCFDKENNLTYTPDMVMGDSRKGLKLTYKRNN